MVQYECYTFVLMCACFSSFINNVTPEDGPRSETRLGLYRQTLQ
jgi:hypothetical protein